MTNKEIPLIRAKEIGRRHNFDGILILGYDFKTGYFCITTWGYDKIKCNVMRNVGEEIATDIENEALEIMYPYQCAKQQEAS